MVVTEAFPAADEFHFIRIIAITEELFVSAALTAIQIGGARGLLVVQCGLPGAAR